MIRFIYYFLAFLFCSCTNQEVDVYQYIVRTEYDKIYPTAKNNKLISFNVPYYKLESISSKFELDDEIIKVRKERIYNYSSKSIADLKIDSTDSQISIEYFILKYSGTELSKPSNFDQVLLKLLSGQDSSTYRGVFNYSRLLSIYAESQYENGNSLVCFAALGYSLHILETCRFKNDLVLLRDQQFSKFAGYLIKEYPFNEVNSSIEYIDNQISNTFKKSFEGQLHLGYVSESKPDKQYEYFLEAKNLAIYPDQKFKIFFNLGFYYEGINQYIKASKYYQKGFDVFDGFSCNPNFSSLLSYCLDFESNKTLFEKYKFSSERISTCSKKEQQLFNYLELNRKSKKKLENTEIINELLDIRKAAEKAFPNKSTLHLEDFYLENFIEILKATIAHSKKVTANNCQQLIELFFDTKHKDLFRKKHMFNVDTINFPESEKHTIEKQLLEINYFKEIRDFKNPIYSKLFKQIASSQSKNTILTNPKIDVHKLNSKLKRDSSIIINIIKGFENYYYYISDGNTTYADSISAKKIDQFVDSLRIRLIRKEHINFTLKSKIDMLVRRLDPKHEKSIIYVSDGSLVHLPDQFIFQRDIDIYNYDNVKSYLENQKLKIEPLSIQLFSFSAKNEEKKKPRRYRELSFGFTEVEKIIEVLQLTKINLKAGNSFKKNELFKNSIELAHISTHASSSSSNRLNNFILLGNDNQKLYGFELYDQNHLPEVVVLSACESGIGLHAYGAGVQTLSRAFLDNGTQTVIKTLWKVNEKATAEFMIDMYTNWAKGVSLYDALEQTKQNFKDHSEYCAPYYWAGFVLEGNPNVFLEMDKVQDLHN